MAGVVGIISRDGHAPIPREELTSLVRAYQDVRGGGPVHEASVDERIRCAKIEGSVGGGIDREGGAWCAAVGKIHADQPSPRAPLATLDGQFAAIRYDDLTDELQVLNDPFGMQAMYVAERDGRTYVSTSATALARHLGAAPDPFGAALFLRTGRQFGPATHWQGVRRLPYATVLRFSGASHTSSTYWRPTVDERVRRMSLQETADHCAEVLLTTLDRRLRGEPCMLADLTGGFDSRLVVAALARLGLPFTAQTSGESDSTDVRLAREVARAGGFQWRQERLPPDWQPDAEALQTALGWGDGALEVLQLSQVLWLQEQRGRSCRLLLTGGGGEHFGPQPWLQEFWRAGRSRQINYDNLMSMRAMTPMDLSFLRTDPTPEVERYTRDVLAQAAEFFSAELNTTQLDAVYIARTTGHFGAYRCASEAYVRSELPFYYKDVFSAGFSAHHRIRNGHRLHRTTIGTISPVIGVVETERGGPAQRMTKRNAHRFAPYYWRLGHTAVRKVRGRGAAPPPEGPAQAGYRRAVRALRADGVLEPRTMRSSELYDLRALESLLARAERPNFGAWDKLGRIVTLELALLSVDREPLVALAT